MNFRAQSVAMVFDQIADLMEIADIEPYKAAAYRRGARSIRRAGDRVDELLAEDRLQELEGIGPALADKAREIVETGGCEQLEQLTEEVPLSLLDLLRVEGLGVKTVSALYRQLGITTLSGLEEAAREKRLRRVAGIGSRREQKILTDIMHEHKRSKGLTLDWADAVCGELMHRLNALPGVKEVFVGGGLRRRCDLIDCVVLLVEVADNGRKLQLHEEVFSGLARGPMEKKERAGYSGWEFTLDIGIAARVYPVPSSSAGTARVRLTGSDSHVRQLCEGGLGDLPPLPEEEDVYAGLDMQWISPELREGRGETDLARAGDLPALISREDLMGDLHCHSDWSDGNASIGEMVRAAEEWGLHYLAITDHSRSLTVAGGLDVDDLRRQGQQIEEVREEHPEFTLLHGVEVDILPDGELDLPGEILGELDLVIASLHSALRQDSQRLTERLVCAARHPHVHIIGHPTGRLLGVRETDAPDLQRVLEVCAEEKKAVEINAHPDRLDLPWPWMERARELGVPLAINSDAHSPENFSLLAYGVDCARKGGCERQHILNAKPIHSWLERVHSK